MGAQCGCRCIRCGAVDLDTTQIRVGPDGHADMHHTCLGCGAHFDHLEGVVFEECGICGYKVS